MENLQEVFVLAIRQVIESESSISGLLTAKCKNNHLFFSMVSRKIYDCFVKNLLKRLNVCNTGTSAEPTMGKIRKLRRKK